MSNDTISSGTRSGVTLAAGDTLTVLNGGTIKAGAEADNSGGTVANATIAGGLLNLSNNAATTGTIAFTAPAGTLEFDDTATPAATFAGFDRTDTIDLLNLTDVADATVAAGTNNRLTIAEGSVAVSLQFDPAQNLTGKPFLESADATGGTLLTFACFAAGTTIATTNGSVAVEHLRVWDQLLRPGHPPVPVIWIGRRHPDPERVQPIRILAGAFAPGIPARDLLLSPDRAIYAKGHLIPVRALLNDATVTREPAGEITYFRIELPAHDVILADGLACERYPDTGNRDAFENAATTILHPDFASRAWSARAYAPHAANGAVVQSVRRALAYRLATRLTGPPRQKTLANPNE